MIKQYDNSNLCRLLLEIEKHKVIMAHSTLVNDARTEAMELLTHNYIWVGNEPLYESDVLEILKKNSYLMNEIDKLRTKLRSIEKEN